MYALFIEMNYMEAELKQLMSLLDFQLDSMPGIDLVTASALIAEIGVVRRFPNANKLARFAGIVPVYFGSAEQLHANWYITQYGGIR